MYACVCLCVCVCVCVCVFVSARARDFIGRGRSGSRKTFIKRAQYLQIEFFLYMIIRVRRLVKYLPTFRNVAPDCR
jgi:hypothetical protein